MKRLPVTLLTGFLGSGKTTLLNRWLRTGALGPVAVIVNEAGAVGIDHLLVEQGSEDTVLIDGGCVCCVQRSGLAETVDGLLRRRAVGEIPAFERVLIETSGLADPVPIMQTFIGDRRLARQTELDAVLAVADLTHVAATLARHPESVAQIAVADRVILTKADLVSEAERAAGLAALDAVNTHAPREDGGGADPLGGTRVERMEWPRAQDRTPGHEGVCVVSGQFPGQLSADALDDWLDATVGVFGPRLLRLKAVLNIAGFDGSLVLHGVQHVVHAPHILPPHTGSPGSNRLLLIGRGIERDVLDDALRALAAAALLEWALLR